MTLLTFVFHAMSVMVLVAKNIEPEDIISPLFNFHRANYGESVTLPCNCPNCTAHEYYWFKQGLERPPQRLAKIYSLNDNGSIMGEFNNIRFSLDIKESNYQLKIANVKISDSATYYCLAKNKETSELCHSTTLSVKGSSFGVSASVYHSETIQEEEPETLSCTVQTLTCGAEHSVYWFRESEGTRPGLIYTQRGSTEQCLWKTKTQTPTCEYNLPSEKLNHSGPATYYCAVVACGHIVFGERNRVHMEDRGKILFLVYALAAVSTFTSLVVVWLSVSLYKIKRTFHTESPAGHSTTSPENAMGFQDTTGIYCEPFVNEPTRREERSDEESKCTYSLLSL